MTNLPTFTVSGVPLTLLDVGDPRLTGPQIGIALSGLEQVHMRHFSDYPHMIEEIGRWREDGWPDPDVVVHNWLALHDGGPVGEFLVHTNTRRGIILFHFFAVDLLEHAPDLWLVGRQPVVVEQESPYRLAGNDGGGQC